MERTLLFVVGGAYDEGSFNTAMFRHGNCSPVNSAQWDFGFRMVLYVE